MYLVGIYTFNNDNALYCRLVFLLLATAARVLAGSESFFSREKLSRFFLDFGWENTAVSCSDRGSRKRGGVGGALGMNGFDSWQLQKQQQQQPGNQLGPRCLPKVEEHNLRKCI